MKSRIALLAAIALALPLTTMAAESGHDHGHDGHGAAPAKLELNAGKKWEIDEPMHKAMNEIKSQIETALPAAHSGKMTNAQYNALAKGLTNQTTFIVQNCKLDPKADAQFHILLGEMISGIDTIEGKQAKTKRAKGVVKFVEVLDAYGKHFNHAGWTPIKH
ncbi:MAG TPA: hypothetical protein VHK70_03525 [Burkholderiaceae bacterium]|jgi:hypothetical protein|nr:hypothetical protein [Burkholderiaceae bacterium]